MSFLLLRELLDYVEAFDKEELNEKNVKNFSVWLASKIGDNTVDNEPVWKDKTNGRSIDSVINTSLVHLFRYAKVYGKLAVNDSPFSTIDEVVFLLNLTHLGNMPKTALIDLNIHEKSTGIQIINRLLERGFISEEVNENDRRSRTVGITQPGKEALEMNMEKVRLASKMVVGNLNQQEKLQLVFLLQKLEMFHHQKYKEGFNL